LEQFMMVWQRYILNGSCVAEMELLKSTYSGMRQDAMRCDCSELTAELTTTGEDSYRMRRLCHIQ
jgi:hypothetical protein